MIRKILLVGSALCVSACSGGADLDSHGDTVDCHAMAAAIMPATLPDGVVGESYSQQLVAFGGEEVFSLESGSLPDGLALSASGLVEGTPSVAGEYEFDLMSTVDDSDAQCPVHPAFGNYSLTILEGS